MSKEPSILARFYRRACFCLLLFCVGLVVGVGGGGGVVAVFVVVVVVVVGISIGIVVVMLPKIIISTIQYLRHSVLLLALVRDDFDMWGQVDSRTLFFCIFECFFVLSTWSGCEKLNQNHPVASPTGSSVL